MLLVSFARLSLGITLAGACCGGLHLTAWANPFPSHLELVLWRAASLTIAVTAPLSVAASVCQTSLHLASRKFGILGGLVPAAMAAAMWVLLVVWYALYRALLVVECYIKPGAETTVLVGSPDSVSVRASHQLNQQWRSGRDTKLLIELIAREHRTRAFRAQISITLAILPAQHLSLYSSATAIVAARCGPIIMVDTTFASRRRCCDTSACRRVS